MRITLGLNESGRRVGESHQHSKLSDKQVDEIRNLHDSGTWGYRRLARLFKTTRATIQHIVTCRRRAQTVMQWRTINVDNQTVIRIAAVSGV